MSAGKIANLARMVVSVGGTGDLTLGSGAAPGYLTVAQAGNIANGDPVSYGIIDGSASETGSAVWSTTGPSLTSRSVDNSTNSNAAINVSVGAQVFICARRQNILSFAEAMSWLTAAETAQARVNLYAAPFDALAFNGFQINGSFDVSQLNGSSSVPLSNGVGAYIVDGWNAQYGSSSLVVAAQQVAPPGSPSFGSAFSNALQVKATTGAALGANDYTLLGNRIEGYRLGQLAWGGSAAASITVGFWVYATIAGTLALCVVNGAGNRSYVANVTINNATTWEYKTVTIAGDTSGTWAKDNTKGMTIAVCFGAGSTFQATVNTWTAGVFLATSTTTNFFASNNNLVAITGFVAVPGTEAPASTRSPFIMRPYPTELILCQRYFEVWKTSGGFDSCALGAWNTSAQVTAVYDFKQTKRAQPVLTVSANSDFAVLYNGGTNPSTMTAFGVLGGADFDKATIQGTATGTPGTQGQAGFISSNNNSTARLYIDAQL